MIYIKGNVKILRGNQIMTKSNKITEGALLTSAYIILVFMTAFIPLLGTFTFFALPIPFILYTAKHNWQPALMMFIAAMMLSLIFATLFSLPMTLLMAFGGIMIGKAIYDKRSAYETWARGTVGFIFGLVIVFIMIEFVFQINIFAEVDQVIAETINMMQSMSNQIGLNNEIDEQMKLLEDQIHLIKDLIPASMAIISILMAFVAQWLSYKIMNRLEQRKLYFPKFTSFNLPISVVWVYFLFLILSFFIQDDGDSLYIVVMNIVLLLMMLLAIQGFSFIFFYADYKKMSKAIPIIILVITLLIPGILLLIVRILGIVDLGYGLKRRIAESKK